MIQKFSYPEVQKFFATGNKNFSCALPRDLYRSFTIKKQHSSANEQYFAFYDRHILQGWLGISENNQITALWSTKPKIAEKLLTYALRQRINPSVWVEGDSSEKINFFHHLGFKIVLIKTDEQQGTSILLMSQSKGSKYHYFRSYAAS